MTMTQRVSPLARLFAVEPENDWRSGAACSGLDPELFFSSEDIVNKQERHEREAAAKQVCGECAVTQSCLRYAIDAGEKYGIWGGLNPQERRAVVRSGRAGERVS